ncbi:uncharacterized protein LOC134310716 [Trichomycterus rosablanca]|uniref:uncharacterized protein LOC134310716 n=1 Tax=Trichomycterus rosablanca TaxID=2290929 RepID=UPI002F35C53C
MTEFIRKLCGRFLKVEAPQSRAVDEIHYKDPSNQLPGQKQNIGFTTRATLSRLLDAGDITPQQVERFHQAALAFLIGAVEYAIVKLPLRETLLKHARFVDVQQRTECEVNDAAYFVERFPELLPYHGPQEHDQLSEEFLDYQLMDIPVPQDPAMFDIEAFWGDMSSLKNRGRNIQHTPTDMSSLITAEICRSGIRLPWFIFLKVTGMSRFPRPSTIAKLVLVLPHSNADAERVFPWWGLIKPKPGTRWLWMELCHPS